MEGWDSPRRAYRSGIARGDGRSLLGGEFPEPRDVPAHAEMKLLTRNLATIRAHLLSEPRTGIADPARSGLRSRERTFDNYGPDPRQFDVLAGELGAEIHALKRQYYQHCSELADALKEQERLEFNTPSRCWGCSG